MRRLNTVHVAIMRTIRCPSDAFDAYVLIRGRYYTATEYLQILHLFGVFVFFDAFMHLLKSLTKVFSTFYENATNADENKTK